MHTQVHTCSYTHGGTPALPEQWAAAVQRPGSRWGFQVPCSRAPHPWRFGIRTGHLPVTSPTPSPVCHGYLASFQSDHSLFDVLTPTQGQALILKLKHMFCQINSTRHLHIFGQNGPASIQRCAANFCNTSNSTPPSVQGTVCPHPTAVVDGGGWLDVCWLTRKAC